MVSRLFGMYGRLSEAIANRVLNPISEIGDIVLFMGQILKTVPSIPRSFRLILDDMLEIGVRSIPIVFVISVFAGATTAWQGNYQLSEYVSMRYLGTAVSKSIILELGPVLTGLIVAGRIGASIAGLPSFAQCPRRAVLHATNVPGRDRSRGIEARTAVGDRDRGGGSSRV